MNGPIVKLLKPILGVLSVGLVITFGFRLLFYIIFKTQDLEPGFSWPTFAFIHGARFDLSALLILNTFFFLVLFFTRIRISKIFLNLWAAVSSFYVLILMADFVYYSLYSSRLGWDFLAAFNGLNADIFFSMGFEFVVLLPILGLIFYLYRLLFYKLFLPLSFQLNIKMYPIYFVVMVLLCLIGFRGGLQKRVLSPQHTWLYSNGSSFFASMTSNPLHNLLRSKKSSNLPNAFKNQKQAYLAKWAANSSDSVLDFQHRPKNVLFIFVESLSSYPYEHNKLPVLKSWVSDHQKDVFLSTDFYANGNLSKDALLSVFFGFPSYFNIHYFESKYAKNTLSGIGQIAKQKDMKSFFLHAAPAGTQFFDVISKAAGFQTYESIIDNFKGDEKFRGTWGVHDEALYEASLAYISKLEKPFLGTLFTTSTHTPFKGTPNSKIESDDEANYFSAVNYADKSLVEFFNKASKQKWFKDTLFIVTGDHSPPLSSDWNRSLKEQSRIPCLIYWPNSNLEKLNFRRVGRHVDIPKTIFDLMGVYPESWTPYGNSLIENTDTKSKVFYTNSNSINLILASKEVLTQPILDESSQVVDAKLNAEQVEKLNDAHLELKDYVYRLEKNSIYQ